jgi:hypothetical protein
MYTPVMAYFRGGEVNKTDPRRLPSPEALGIEEQGTDGQFHEPVVTDLRWEKSHESGCRRNAGTIM